MCGGIVSASRCRCARPDQPGAPPSGRCTWPTTSGASPATFAAGAAMAPSARSACCSTTSCRCSSPLRGGANLMLVALGLVSHRLHPRPGRASRSLGQRLWARIQPLTRRFLPARSVAQAFPRACCGLPALRAGSQRAGHGPRHRLGRAGAALMLAFGSARCPTCCWPACCSPVCATWCAIQAVRTGAGLVVLAFGVFGVVTTPSLGSACGTAWCPLLMPGA